MTTMNTWTAPATNVCAVSSTMITRSDGSRPSVREPGERLGRDRRGFELAARALGVLRAG